MCKRLSAIFLLCLIALPAMAQQTAPQAPQWAWPGPWWMGSAGSWWQFWWLCPLVFMLMFVACMFFCFGRRPRTDAHDYD
jgi:hypothetical protein